MKQQIKLLLTLFLLPTPAIATVDVFTLTHYPAPSPNEEVQVFYLNEMLRLEHKLSRTLSADSKQAEAEAKQFIQTENISHKESPWLKAISGITKAWALGIEKVPAVVFDEQYVVYGTTDLDVARGLLAQFRKEKR